MCMSQYGTINLLQLNMERLNLMDASLLSECSGQIVRQVLRMVFSENL